MGKNKISFDDFIKKYNVEVMSFSDIFVARWKSQKTYKKNMQRITETTVHQTTGKNYIELTKNLKKQMRKLFHLPWSFLFGTGMCILSFFYGIKEYDGFLMIGGIIFGLPMGYYFVLGTLEYIQAMEILKSNSEITKDNLKLHSNGSISLFKDELEKFIN